jgi:hypothetical protein
MVITLHQVELQILLSTHGPHSHAIFHFTEEKDGLLFQESTTAQYFSCTRGCFPCSSETRTAPLLV